MKAIIIAIAIVLRMGFEVATAQQVPLRLEGPTPAPPEVPVNMAITLVENHTMPLDYVAVVPGIGNEQRVWLHTPDFRPADVDITDVLVQAWAWKRNEYNTGNVWYFVGWMFLSPELVNALHYGRPNTI
jgi:hypothetical protein